MEEAKNHIQRPANEQGSTNTGQSRDPEITMKTGMIFIRRGSLMLQTRKKYEEIFKSAWEKMKLNGY